MSDSSTNEALAFAKSGDAHAKNGDMDRAIADYDQAIQLNPNCVDAYFNRGSAYREKGDLDRAIADFNQVILRQNPEDASAYYWRGKMNAAKKDYDHAIYDFSQMLRLKSDNARLYIERADAYWEKKDINQAMADYKTAFRLAPDDSFISGALDKALKVQLARIKLDGISKCYNGDSDLIIEDMTLIIHFDANCAFAYFMRGAQYAKKGDWYRAKEDYETGLRFEPNDDVAKKCLDDVREMIRANVAAKAQGAAQQMRDSLKRNYGISLP
jgi:tetratricopeptide (TPR) repeat protein